MGVPTSEIAAAGGGGGGGGTGNMPWSDLIVADGTLELDKINLVSGTGLTMLFPSSPVDGDRLGILIGPGDLSLDAGAGKVVQRPDAISGSGSQAISFEVGPLAYLEYKFFGVASQWLITARGGVGAVMSMLNEGSEQAKYINAMNFLGANVDMQAGPQAEITISTQRAFPDFGSNVLVANDTLEFGKINRLDVTAGGNFLLPSPTDGDEIIFTVVYGTNTWNLSAPNSAPIVIHGQPEGSASAVQAVSPDTRGGVLKYSATHVTWYLFLNSSAP